MPTKYRAFRIGLIGIALWASDVRAQNLLSNGDFDSSLAGWSQVPSSSWQFNSTQGSPAPGSALGTNTQSVTNVSIIMRQCHAVTPGRIYRFGVACRLVAGPATNADGGCGSSLNWYSGPDCTGQRLAYNYSPTVTASTWTDSNGAGVAPPAAVSAEIGISVYKNETGGSVRARLDSAFLIRDAVPVRGDFDGDGHADLVLRNTVNDDSRLWTMNGVDRVSSTLFNPQIPSHFSIVASDDMNQDGKSDLVLRHNTTGDLWFWYLDGPDQLGYGVFNQTPPPGWTVAASGDFDHDGGPDLLLRNLVTQKLSVWTLPRLGGLGILVPTPDQAADANWKVAAALDFDNDGNRDLLWYNSSSGKIVLWRLDANLVRTAGEFTIPDSAGNSNWQVLAGGDYGVGPGGVANSNDIVWRNSTSGKFVVWHMDPASVPLTRTSGEFTNPDGPNVTNPTDWTIVGPK